jgi:DNA polymerase III epsilon subunit-like protein
LMTNGFVLEQVLGDWCRDIDWTQSVVGAWGIDFEARFLKSAFDLTKRVIPYPYQMIDIRTMAHIPKMRWGEIDYLGLREACELYNITCDKDQLHDALYDTQKEAEVLLAVLEELR